MTSSLVGSEMCIRDSRIELLQKADPEFVDVALAVSLRESLTSSGTRRRTCLLYTSDAADDM
eukprot:2367808-Prorocentrum_lima.AAC.1